MITFRARLSKTLRCSFCGKSEHHVQKLIAGPAVFICDECVNICVDVLRENGPEGPAPVQKRRLGDRVRDWFGRLTADPGVGTLPRFSR